MHSSAPSQQSSNSNSAEKFHNIPRNVRGHGEHKQIWQNDAADALYHA